MFSGGDFFKGPSQSPDPRGGLRGPFHSPSLVPLPVIHIDPQLNFSLDVTKKIEEISDSLKNSDLLKKPSTFREAKRYFYAKRYQDSLWKFHDQLYLQYQALERDVTKQNINLTLTMLETFTNKLTNQQRVSESEFNKLERNLNAYAKTHSKLGAVVTGLIFGAIGVLIGFKLGGPMGAYWLGKKAATIGASVGGGVFGLAGGIWANKWFHLSRDPSNMLPHLGKQILMADQRFDSNPSKKSR